MTNTIFTLGVIFYTLTAFWLLLMQFYIGTQFLTLRLILTFVLGVPTCIAHIVVFLHVKRSIRKDHEHIQDIVKAALDKSLAKTEYKAISKTPVPDNIQLTKNPDA